MPPRVSSNYDGEGLKKEKISVHGDRLGWAGIPSREGQTLLFVDVTPHQSHCFIAKPPSFISGKCFLNVSFMPGIPLAMEDTPV